MAEHQGVRGELTVERLIEEEHWVKLSTCEVVGVAKKLVEGSVQWRRGSGKSQNGLVDGGRSLWWEGLEND